MAKTISPGLTGQLHFHRDILLLTGGGYLDYRAAVAQRHHPAQGRHLGNFGLLAAECCVTRHIDRLAGAIGRRDQQRMRVPAMHQSQLLGLYLQISQGQFRFGRRSQAGPQG